HRCVGAGVWPPSRLYRQVRGPLWGWRPASGRGSRYFFPLAVQLVAPAPVKASNHRVLTGAAMTSMTAVTDQHRQQYSEVLLARAAPLFEQTALAAGEAGLHAQVHVQGTPPELCLQVSR